MLHTMPVPESSRSGAWHNAQGRQMGMSVWAAALYGPVQCFNALGMPCNTVQLFHATQVDAPPIQAPVPAVAAKGPSTPAQTERSSAHAAGNAPEDSVFETPPGSPAVAAQPAPRATQGQQEAGGASLKSCFEPAAGQVCCLSL